MKQKPWVTTYIPVDVTVSPRSKLGLIILLLPGLDIFFHLVQTKSLTALSLVVASGAFCALSFYFLLTGLNLESAQSAKHDDTPKLPRKVIGALLLGVSTAVLAFHKTADPIVAMQYAIGCSVLGVLAFGIDELQRLVSAPASPEERLNARLNAIEIKLTTAAQSIRSMDDPELASAFVEYRIAVQGLIEAVHFAPERHRSVKRHLGPLIDGAIDAGRYYQRLSATGQNQEARQVMLDLLASLTVEYSNAQRDYRIGDNEALAREADVLNEMLARIRPAE